MQIYLSSVISIIGYPAELYSGWKLRHGYQNSESFVLPSASGQTPGHYFCQAMTISCQILSTWFSQIILPFDVIYLTYWQRHKMELHNLTLWIHSQLEHKLPETWFQDLFRLKKCSNTDVWTQQITQASNLNTFILYLTTYNIYNITATYVDA
jgi:hypothetical protein